MCFKKKVLKKKNTYIKRNIKSEFSNSFLEIISYQNDKILFLNNNKQRVLDTYIPEELKKILKSIIEIDSSEYRLKICEDFIKEEEKRREEENKSSFFFSFSSF